MCHVLIATPYEKDRLFWKKLIRRDFFNVTLLPDVKSVDEVMEIAKTKEINILILSLNENMGNAFACKTEVISYQPNVKVILVDDTENFNHLHKSLRCGAIDYMVRPLDETEGQQSIHRSILSLNQVSLLHHTSRSIADNQTEQTKQMIQYIHQHYMDAINLDTLASFSHMHKNYVSRLFKEAVGMTFIDYLTYYRVEQAKKQLSHSEQPVAWVSESVGYIDPGYFSRIFKRETGYSPNQFRQLFKGNYIPGDIAFALKE